MLQQKPCAHCVRPVIIDTKRRRVYPLECVCPQDIQYYVHDPVEEYTLKPTWTTTAAHPADVEVVDYIQAVAAQQEVF